VEQAKQALAGAKAAYVEASAHHERTQRFFRQEAATERDLEQALAVFQQAQAGMKQAEKGMTATQAAARQAEKVVEEARVALGYTKVTAPEAGQIAKRLVEPGDLAQPGKPLVVLQMPEALRLEAHVREGLIQRVLPGSRLRVNVDAVETTLDGTVEELIPSADPSTRTFLVKVGIPAVPGLYPGMFGRLLIPLEERKTVVVPLNAIQRIGQMTVVKIRQQGQWVHCFVRTGETLDGKIAILSGLEGNEEIAIHTGEHE
jgi:RND family efflux transporter MFP subunit